MRKACFYDPNASSKLYYNGAKTCANAQIRHFRQKCISCYFAEKRSIRSIRSF